MAMWLNVDFDPREYSYRLHCDNCRFILRIPTPYKGISELKRDSGWLSFKTVREAKEWHEENYSEIPWKPCRICFR
jgi:hypothetical protein